MARIDRLKEEIGWLKVVFAVSVAIDASLLGWLAQNYRRAGWLLLLVGLVAAIAVTFVVAWVNRVVYVRIGELDDA